LIFFNIIGSDSKGFGEQVYQYKIVFTSYCFSCNCEHYLKISFTVSFQQLFASRFLVAIDFFFVLVSTID